MPNSNGRAARQNQKSWCATKKITISKVRKADFAVTVVLLAVGGGLAGRSGRPVLLRLSGKM
jgi:hypothetical protein